MGCAPFPDWTPDAYTWKKFQKASGEISLTTTTAPFERYLINGELSRRRWRRRPFGSLRRLSPMVRVSGSILAAVVTLGCTHDRSCETIFVPSADDPAAAYCAPDDRIWVDIQDRLSREEIVVDDTEPCL